MEVEIEQKTYWRAVAVVMAGRRDGAEKGRGWRYKIMEDLNRTECLDTMCQNRLAAQDACSTGWGWKLEGTMGEVSVTQLQDHDCIQSFIFYCCNIQLQYHACAQL